jgi:hypothetical protein
MQVSLYTSFEDVPGKIRLGLSYPRQPRFLLSFDWYALLFETSLRDTMSPRIYVATDDSGDPVGGLFCGVLLRGAGRSLRSLTNFYSLEYAPSLLPEGSDQDAVVRSLVAFLAGERPRWDSLHWTSLREDARAARAAVTQLRESGFAVHTYFQYENWHTDASAETFATYFQKRPSRLRNTITRKRKSLERTHEVAIKLLRGEDGRLEDAVRDFTKVYNSSWKKPEPYPDFIPRLAGTCARHGILRLGVLYVGGEPAAGQLWINGSGRAIIYKLAYDERLRDLGVGSILSGEMFRVAIDEDHVAQIDYGVGGESYKKEWMTSVQEIEGVEAFNRRTPRGALLAALNAAKRAIRRVPSRRA